MVDKDTQMLDDIAADHNCAILYSFAHIKNINPNMLNSNIPHQCTGVFFIPDSTHISF